MTMMSLNTVKRSGFQKFCESIIPDVVLSAVSRNS